MGNLEGKKILIFQQRHWAFHVGKYLADALHEQGCRLACVTFKKTTDKKIKEWNREGRTHYEYILNFDEIMNNPEKIIGSNKITFEKICKDLNLDSVWPLIQANRMLIKSYRSYYYNFRQNVPDEHIVLYFKALYKSLRDLFESFQPDLVFTAASVDEKHALLNLFADKHKIPYISVFGSKVDDYFIFSYDYQHTKADFLNRFQMLNSEEIESKNRDRARAYINEFRNKLKVPSYMKPKTKSFMKRVRAELAPYRKIFRWYTLDKLRVNYLDRIGPSIDYSPPRITLRDHYVHKHYKNFAEKFDYYPIDNIQKFVYFPLQFQPEATIDLRAPYFNNQIETARLAAMSLPDDYTLVVKDHPSMLGKRKPSYLKKIAYLPNVKLVDFRIPSDKVLKQSDLVISSSGTTIYEAAFYNKPVIQLGDLGVTLALPNVFKHTDMTTLSAKIKEVFRVNLKTGDYERELENYVASIYDCGYNLDYYNMWKGGQGPKEKLINIFLKEIGAKLSRVKP